MKRAELKQYKAGIRLLFVSQADFDECYAKVREKGTLPVLFWGKNKFVTDRDKYPWYFYIESTEANDVAFLSELIFKYQDALVSATENAQKLPVIEPQEDSLCTQQELIPIEKEAIFNIVMDVKESLEKLDELLLIQFGAISEQIVKNAKSRALSEEIDFNTTASRLEGAMKNYLSDSLAPFLAKISGDESQVSEILKTMNNVGDFAILRRENVDLSDKNKKLTVDLQEATDLIELEKEDFEKEIAKRELSIGKLKAQLEECSNNDDSGSGYIADLLDQLDVNDQKISPLNCLRHIETIHQSKVLVLPSARESAKKASNFEQGLKLLLMINRLIEKYLPAYKEVGDTRASEIFPKGVFAARESESTMKKHYDTRCFDYDRKSVLMERHLKIGVVDNERFMIRLHFLPEPDKNRIVIGYCGKHLPT